MFIKTRIKLIIRKRSNEANSGSICLLFTQNRNPQRISLNKFVPLDAWENTNGNFIKSNYPNAKELNLFLRAQLSKAEILIMDHERENKSLSFTQFKELFFDAKATSFIQFCSDELLRRLESGNYSKETIRSNRSKLAKLERFAPKLTYQELDVRFLEKYERHMKLDLGNDANTVFAAMKFIRTMLNAARKLDLTEVYPFDKYKVVYKKDTRDRLIKEEVEMLQKIYDQNTLEEGKQEVLKYFLFACYTGLTWSDLVSLKYSEIERKLSSYVIHKRRKKTDQVFVVPLISNAKRLIDITQEQGKVFPNMISNQKANLGIKEIIKTIKIRKHVTFHVARHTFGTVALNNGIPKEVVQKMLGHASSHQTDLYSKVLDDYIITEMKKMDDPIPSDIIPNNLDADVMNDYKKVRAQLISSRIMNDKSEREMAHILGTTEDRYMGIEKGEFALNVLELLTLKRVLGVAIEV